MTGECLFWCLTQTIKISSNSKNSFSFSQSATSGIFLTQLWQKSTKYQIWNFFVGEGKLKSDSSPGGSVVVNRPQQGATKSNQSAYTYNKPVTIVKQVAKCSDCSRPTGRGFLAADNLSSEAKKPQCNRTLRDRSQDKSSRAKKALDIAKRIHNQLEFDTSIADNINDQRERELWS
jgi:hypothetical protein